MRSVQMRLNRSWAWGAMLGAGLAWGGIAAAAAPPMESSAETPALPAQLQDFDAYVEGVRKQFDVPGIAVAIVKDGRVVLERGFGARELEKGSRGRPHRR